MADKEKTSRHEQRRKRRKAEDKKAKGWLREWGDALLFAIVAALIIRTFFFEAYRIPTPSMEDTLLVGDFLVVSKINYGPRTPMVLGIPFTNINLPGVTLPWIRLPGFDEIERNDVVVFNYPIDIAPISAKTSYVKRCVGLPGDTLALDNKQLMVNGKPAKQFPGLEQQYVVSVTERVRLSRSKVSTSGGRLVNQLESNRYVVNMTDALADTMQNWPEVTAVEPYVLPERIDEFGRTNFSFSQGFSNHHHMPPITVPYEGQKITLTPENWPVYENVLTRYERNTVERNGDSFTINGKQTNTYTIKKDYYFMMGDNRDNSEDSRFWGFVPHDHIVGEAIFIYFSWDAERTLPRFGRILDIIN